MGTFHEKFDRGKGARKLVFDRMSGSSDSNHHLLTIVLGNVHSLHNQMDELCANVQFLHEYYRDACLNVSRRPGFILEIEARTMDLENHKIVRVDRTEASGKTRGGGVCMYNVHQFTMV